MKKTITFIAALLVAAVATASQPNVKVESKLLADNSLQFEASVKGYGSITIELIFLETENCSVNEKVIKGVDGSGVFYTIQPIDAALPVKATYNYNWLQGKVDSGVELAHIYRLPFDGATTAHTITNIEAGIYHGNFGDFTMWQFPLLKGTDIYPVRSGKVIRIEGFKTPDSEEAALTTAISNEIYIEHADGMISQYIVMDSRTLKVREGDTVHPDTPLASAGAIDRETFGVRLAMYYYVSSTGNNPRSIFWYKKYVNPIFATSDGNIQLKDDMSITAKTTKAIINKEKPKKSFWKRLFGGK